MSQAEQATRRSPFDRIVVRVIHAPLACIGACVVAAIACFALWSPLERNMVPSFRETDLLIEWQGPPGTSLQAMTRSTENLIRDLRQIPGVQNAFANLRLAFEQTRIDAIFLKQLLMLSGFHHSSLLQHDDAVG